MRPHLVAIAGGTASGKTTLARRLYEIAGADNACIVELDAYYRCQDHLPFEERLKTNYDHPDAFEFELLLEHLLQLREGKTVPVPVYDFVAHTRRTDESQFTSPRKLVIVEGLLTLNHAELRSSFDMKVFVTAPAEMRLARRMERDIRERGRTEGEVLARWEKTVHPMHQLYCEPTQIYADTVIDGATFTAETAQILWNEISRRTKVKPPSR